MQSKECMHSLNWKWWWSIWHDYDNEDDDDRRVYDNDNADDADDDNADDADDDVDDDVS